MSTRPLNKTNFELELKAEAILQHCTESIEDVQCSQSSANDVIRIFDDGKIAMDELKKIAHTSDEKAMLLDEIQKLHDVEKKKLAKLKEVKTEIPSLFNKPKGSAVAETQVKEK